MINRETIQSLGDLFKKGLQEELIKQGHKDTGKLINSIEFDIEFDGKDYWLSFSYLFYGEIVRRGVKAENIPFSGRTGGKLKVSKYIQALMAYGQRKGVKDPKRFAFAVAFTHKREGMPTKRSSRFSKTGRRKFFVEDAVNEVQPKAITLLTEKIGYLIEKNIIEQFIHYEFDVN